ncbi:MAG: hypothetical protein J7621_04665 [Niastella sp.]|nr:hypothetical protein [Niastella sp.]
MQKLLPGCMLALLFITACKDRLSPEAIKAVTSSLDNNNQLILDQNYLLSQVLDEKTKDPQTAQRAIPWELRARKIRSSTATIIKYIDELKRKLNKTDKEGSRLYSMLVGFNNQIVAILDAKGFVDRPFLQQEVVRDAQKFKQETALLLGLVEDSAATQPVDSASWENLNIVSSDPLLTQAMLSQLQNDVLIAENRLVNYCHDQTKVIHHEYLVYQPLITMDRSYVKPGESIEIIAGVGAFSFKVEKLTINGKKLPISDNGTATWRFIATGKPGVYKVPLMIECFSPDGSLQKMNRELSYTIEK